jgi:signal peptidase
MGRVRSASATLGLCACVALAALLFIPAALGYQRYVITSGSMTGTYDRGSLVFDRVVPVADLRRGDVITYRPPPGSGPSGLVTHRIVWAGHERDGTPAFHTKGDANTATDPWRFTLHDRTQARVAFHVPYVGFALAALAERRLRMLLIGLPALLIGLAWAADLWREDPESEEALAA